MNNLLMDIFVLFFVNDKKSTIHSKILKLEQIFLKNQYVGLFELYPVCDESSIVLN